MKHSIATDEVLEAVSGYSLGMLDAPEKLALEEHLALGCEVCDRELESFQKVAAALALSVSPALPPTRVRRKLEEFLQAKTRPENQTAASQPNPPFVTVRSNEGEWSEALAGVLVKRLFVDRERGTVTSLFKLGPGTCVPEHFHTGVEECLVLEGDVCANDTRLGPGDYHCAPAGSVHQQLTTEHGALLLIVAAHAAPAQLHAS
jgi:anti-sigma factor ChrR (cupin superfamily)